jgi:hypothetical protein
VNLDHVFCVQPTKTHVRGQHSPKSGEIREAKDHHEVKAAQTQDNRHRPGPARISTLNQRPNYWDRVILVVQKIDRWYNDVSQIFSATMSYLFESSHAEYECLFSANKMRYSQPNTCSKSTVLNDHITPPKCQVKRANA